MKRHFPALVGIMLVLGGAMTAAAEARLETGDIFAYQQSLDELNAGLTRQEIADLNWQLTLLAYGDKPASMTDEEYGIALMTFIVEQTDCWLERLAPYDGYTFDQIMQIKR